MATTASNLVIEVAGFRREGEGEKAILNFNAMLTYDAIHATLVTGLRILKSKNRVYCAAHRTGAGKFYNDVFFSEATAKLVVQALRESDAVTRYPDFFPLPPDAYKGMTYSTSRLEYFSKG